MAWRFWLMKQLTGCSTPAPNSSASKQWTSRTGSNDEVVRVSTVSGPSDISVRNMVHGRNNDENHWYETIIQVFCVRENSQMTHENVATVYVTCVFQEIFVRFAIVNLTLILLNIYRICYGSHSSTSKKWFSGHKNGHTIPFLLNVRFTFHKTTSLQ